MVSRQGCDRIESISVLVREDVAGCTGVKKLLQEVVIWPQYMPDFFKGIRRPVKVSNSSCIRQSFDGNHYLV